MIRQAAAEAPPEPPEPPVSGQAHALSASAVTDRLGVDPERGLDATAVDEHRRRWGVNRRPTPPVKPWWEVLVGNLAEPMAIMLLAAAAVAGAVLGEVVDAVAILAIVALNAVIGTVQEGRAGAALQALRAMDAGTAQVVRDGRRQLVDPVELVVGDVVVLGAGDAVPADVRLLAATGLSVDQSLLTGESLAVEKRSDVVGDVDTPEAERFNIAYAGTVVTAGSATGVVVATGGSTQLGGIAASLEGPQPQTPLQIELASLARLLGAATLTVAAVVLLGVIVRDGAAGGGMERAFLLAVALAVAAVPEGLPTAVAVGLALGVRRMADRGAIVRRLTAVETLGSADVLLTDKTGTLTMNRLRVDGFHSSDGRALRAEEISERLVTSVVACNDASPDGTVGDAVDRALLEAVAPEVVESVLSDTTRLSVIPFDSERKRMTVELSGRHGTRVVVKGAPEQVLDRCAEREADGRDVPLDTDTRASLRETADRLAAAGARVLAFADRPSDGDGDLDRHDGSLVFLGYAAMADPVRSSAADAVAIARSAGVDIVMVTGDHVGTAGSVADRVGLRSGGAITGDDLRRDGLPPEIRDRSVYARMDPAQKLSLVERLQESGATVAVTGDGVNDAPALHRADIGIAMGGSGSDVAREASDLVITDDDLSTIVTAIREGRGIYDNIRKVVDYLVAGNLSEIAVVVTSLVLFPGIGLPLTPVQLLWVNLLTDGLPALALGGDATSDDVMVRPPRPKDSRLLDGRRLLRLAGRGAVIAGAVVGAIALARYALDGSWETARTIGFTTLVVAHLLYAMVVRVPQSPWSSRPLLGAVGVALIAQASIVLFPVAGAVFDTVALGGSEWALVAACGLAPVAVLTLAARHRSGRG